MVMPVLGVDEFVFRTLIGEFVIRVRRRRSTLTVQQTRLADRIAFALRSGIEASDPEVLAVGRRLEHALSSSFLRAFNEHEESFEGGPFADSLPSLLADGLRDGLLLVEQRQRQSLTERREEPADEIVPPPRTREANDTFFEVRLVDEIGQALSGVPVEFASEGEFSEATTNAAGVALLEHVETSAASVSVTDSSRLDEILESRWQKPRLGKPRKEGNTTELVFTGDPIGPIALKAAVPNTVVLTPPLGVLFVELFDKTGRVRHAGRKYDIDGPMQFSGTTDPHGRFRHEGVFPGDYTLRLALEFSEAKDQKTDTYASPLVVTDAARATPQVRMLGVVPRVCMARMRGMLFDTNKCFLLPTAVESLRKLREIYEANRPSELLIVGHTDTTAEPDINDPLSRERAKSMQAYLQDDVDTWLENYEVFGAKRWGTREDRLMIAAMSGFAEREANEPIVQWFQRTRALRIDGVAGPQTRRQLITEYMQLDGVNLIQDQGLDLVIETHGAGENFPLGQTATEVEPNAANREENAFDRRVELFFFDAEFGISPAPGAADGEEYLEWRRRAVDEIELVAGRLAATPISLMEVKDIFFRTDSAVVHQNLVCPSVFALALVFARERRRHRLVIAGHTDTRAPDAFNQPLSEERAENALACLEGNRKRFVELSLARSKVADHEQILQFVTSKLGFDCDPARIENNAFSSATSVRAFQEQYNSKRSVLGVPEAEALSPDGRVGPKTWGAFFDCYEAFLASQVSSAADVQTSLLELSELRKLLTFVDNGRRSIGFGERYPSDRRGVDNVASATNRRVELLFFPEADLPDLSAPLDICEIYLPGRYARQPIDPCAEPARPPPPPPPPRPKQAAKLGRIFVRAVRADGTRVQDIEAFLFDVSVGRTQVDAAQSGTGELDFGERNPSVYEVAIVRSGFSGGPEVFRLAEAERKVVAVLMTPIGSAEPLGRISIETVTTVFKMGAFQQVSPFVGDFAVIFPPSIAASFPNAIAARAVRDRQAQAEHAAAIELKLAELRGTHGAKLRRIQLDGQPPVVEETFSVDDAVEGKKGAPIVTAILNFTDIVTSRTIVLSTVDT